MLPPFLAGTFSTALITIVLLVGGVASSRPESQAAQTRGKLDFVHPECVEESFTPVYQRLGQVPASSLEIYPAESKCRGSTTLGDQFLVTTTFATDITWMAQHVTIPYFIYRAGNTSGAHYHPNHGNEAMGYLMFIAEYYDCLPKVTLFAHPHRISKWHSTGNLDENINKVRWELITGYVPLRRVAFWFDSYTLDPLENLRGQEVWEEDRQQGDCGNLRNGTAYDGMADAQFWRAEWIGKAWDTFFEPAGLGPIMEKTRCSVTAEFFVTRERIRRHPREFYLKALAYLQTAEKKWGFNDYSIGAVFENLWHYIFGEPAFMEEMPLEECELYDCT